MEGARRPDPASVFGQGMSIVPLIDALKEAKIPYPEFVASTCLSNIKKDNADRVTVLSYVVAYTYDFGENCELTDNPYWRINDALSRDSIIALRNVRKFIWGLLKGLRILPYKQFDVLYRGMNKCVDCEEETVIEWTRFTSATRDKAAAEKFLGISPNGEKEGTLITIRGGYGYDIEEFSTMPREQEVVMEPGIKVLIKSVKGDRLRKIEVEFANDGNLLLDLIPRLEARRAAIKNEEDRLFSEAMDLKKRGRYEECHDKLQKLLVKGHLKGMIEFAFMNLFGNYPRKEPGFGFTVLEQCEECEDGRVFYGLGVCYQMGYGVKKDLETSNVYFLRSLLCGYPPAVQKCQGLDKNFTKAYMSGVDRTRYECVKSEGSDGDMLCLGIWGFCLLQGFFDVKDESRGIDLLKRSAERGNPFGQNILGNCYFYGWGVTRDVRIAFECYKASAEQGDSDGQHNLGLCYQSGTGVDKDSAEAVRLFKQSAEQGHSESQYLLACCYLVGEGADQDPTEAVRWFRLSAEQGHSDAQSHLGFCYTIGRGVGKNFEKALEWFDRAIEQGNKDAQAYKKILLETESEKGKKRFWIFGKKK